MVAGSPFVLRVPIDVSQVPDFTPGRRISVLARSGQGYREHRLVTFETQDNVTVTFQLEQMPESLRVLIGPGTATPSELRYLHTPCVTVPPSAWHASAEVELPPIRVSAWHWWWWQHWRQSFYVSGLVVNAYGRPVAGAEVSAFDVDAWWWWTTREQVGSAVTRSDGSFFIEFTRCCGWRPWWWWATRDWQVDAELMEMTTSFVHQNPELGLPAADANSAPSLEIFQPLLTSGTSPLPPMIAATLSQAGKTINPAALEPIRERLVEILPRRFPLPIWPWSEWSPWEDCGANLIFRVTETQGNETAVLVDEGAVSAHWDIPACFDVKLLAREATSARASTDWTLVDHLFPQVLSFPASQKQREPSARILSPRLLNFPGFECRLTGKKPKGRPGSAVFPCEH
jgi:hypothetical protein